VGVGGVYSWYLSFGSSQYVALCSVARTLPSVPTMMAPPWPFHRFSFLSPQPRPSSLSFSSRSREPGALEPLCQVKVMGGSSPLAGTCHCTTSQLGAESLLISETGEYRYLQPG
jgi:hypothetical protein